MKFGSLFSGIGGFDLGFERAGLRCAWQCEIDDKARAVLDRHWPQAEKHTDVRHIGKHNLQPVDLICGGFPCQDLSVAGKRAGLAGERSGLWFEFHRILSELRPGWVVIENVPGLLSSNGGRDFAVVLRGLVELGYGCAWRVLDTQYFGVAQRRRRVFVVGSLGDGRAAQVLFERESGLGDTAPRRQAGERATHAVTNSSVSFGYRYDPNGEELIPVVANAFNGYTGGADDNDAQGRHLVPALAYAFTERGRKDGRSLEWQEEVAYNLFNPGEGGRAHERLIAHTLRAEGHDASAPAGERGAGDGTGRGVPITVFQQNQRNEVRDLNNLAGALASEPGMKQQNYLSVAMGVRRLMPVECERLQGFPDGWTAEGVNGPQADSARYRQLGNAVCVNVAEWLGHRLATLS